ncbi:hypothetical protein MTR_7g009225 [Medicago truncatula]|uniref:Uncharacterized protein n=1 Tax=Medicago truncatula TaxID=3880 RepID=A0A072TWM0_MEDTR|nr:hypothetical protein MTR_7g009225 [Medicago truncatula]
MTVTINLLPKNQQPHAANLEAPKQTCCPSRAHRKGQKPLRKSPPKLPLFSQQTIVRVPTPFVVQTMVDALYAHKADIETAAAKTLAQTTTMQ